MDDDLPEDSVELILLSAQFVGVALALSPKRRQAFLEGTDHIIERLAALADEAPISDPARRAAAAAKSRQARAWWRTTRPIVEKVAL
jgi:hypothetical protein